MVLFVGCLVLGLTGALLAQASSDLSMAGTRALFILIFASALWVSEAIPPFATGILITALHRAGLVTLTHTPSPMMFLNEILERPTSERPFLLLVVGYPAEGVEVPDIGRKELEEVTSFITG